MYFCEKKCAANVKIHNFIWYKKVVGPFRGFMALIIVLINS